MIGDTACGLGSSDVCSLQFRRKHPQTSPAESLLKHPVIRNTAAWKPEGKGVTEFLEARCGLSGYRLLFSTMKRLSII